MSFDHLAETLRAVSPGLAVGLRVQVYRNLHHGKGPVHYWSIRSARTGLVLGVVVHAVLEGVELRVQEGARQTVVVTGRRSVHAYAVGRLREWDEDASPKRPRSLVRFTYNPTRGPDFTRAHNDPTPVYGAEYMWFDVDGAWTRPGSSKHPLDLDPIKTSVAIGLSLALGELPLIAAVVGQVVGNVLDAREERPRRERGTARKDEMQRDTLEAPQRVDDTGAILPATWPKEAPALVALRDQLDERWPARSRAADGIVAHHAANPGSDHARGDALDVTFDPKRGPDLEALAATLLGDMRTRYVIFNRRIAKPELEGGAWRPYSGPGRDPHEGHLHLSIYHEGREDAEPWDLPAAESHPPAPLATGSATYVVEARDSMDCIARKLGARGRPHWLRELCEANPRKPVRVVEGRRLGWTMLRAGEILLVPPAWVPSMAVASDAGDPDALKTGIAVATTTASVLGTAATLAPAAAAAAAFAISTAIGTAIPIPVIGTAIGVVVGAFTAAGIGIAALARDKFKPSPLQAMAYLEFFHLDPALLFLGVDNANTPEKAARLVRYLRLVAGIVPNHGPLYNPVSDRSCKNPYLCRVDPDEPLTDPKVLAHIYAHARRGWAKGARSKDFASYVLPSVRTPTQAKALLAILREHTKTFAGLEQWSASKHNDGPVCDEVRALRRLAGESGPDPVLSALFGDVTVQASPRPHHVAPAHRASAHPMATEATSRATDPFRRLRDAGPGSTDAGAPVVEDVPSAIYMRSIVDVVDAGDALFTWRPITVTYKMPPARAGPARNLLGVRRCAARPCHRAPDALLGRGDPARGGPDPRRAAGSAAVVGPSVGEPRPLPDDDAPPDGGPLAPRAPEPRGHPASPPERRGLAARQRDADERGHRLRSRAAHAPRPVGRRPWENLGARPPALRRDRHRDQLRRARRPRPDALPHLALDERGDPGPLAHPVHRRPPWTRNTSTTRRSSCSWLPGAWWPRGGTTRWCRCPRRRSTGARSSPAS